MIETTPFRAREYLDPNHDIAKALAEGRLRSAWGHFADHGYAENRKGVPEAIQRKANAVMSFEAPLAAPIRLISRVHGSSDADDFERLGRRVALDTYSASNTYIDFERPLRVLDFGCGCGRVLPYMSALAPSSTFYGTDIDSEAVHWCSENYRANVASGRYHFAVNRDVPPLPFSTGFFDFVYGISVFTHLPEDMQLAWLSELGRITKPRGMLVLSTHGEALIRNFLSPPDRRAFDKKGFQYFPLGNTEGLPDFYQTAWHASSYIEKVWSRFFTIVRQVPAGIADHQDLILGRK